MLWTIVVVLVVLWLLGFFGPRLSSGFPKTGNLIHILIVIAVILLILRLLGVLETSRALTIRHGLLPRIVSL